MPEGGRGGKGGNGGVATPTPAPIDYRLIIVLRLLVYLRDHEYVARAWQWLDMESRARLGLFAIRIQCLMRKALAKKCVFHRREEVEKMSKARFLELMVKKIQSWMRMVLAYRQVVYLAQQTLRKYVPHMQQPYYYHPYTKVKSYKKPLILHQKECYAITIPDKSLEQVVLCFACHVRKAVVNCEQCEESMCMVCFDSLHCKGIRARHTTYKIPVCAYCTIQVASISCLTCILTPPAKGHIKESIAHSQRGHYCDACFRFEHSPAQNKKYEANPTYRDNIRDMVLYSKEVYMVHKYISTPVHTHHQYEFVHTQCEACNVYSASWRCAECVMVYCHVCMVGIHSKHKGYIHHKVEVLPYYTPVMHESYKKDVLKQELNVQLERVRQRLGVEREEVKYYSSIILQAW
ncbi:hypothetical protein EON63_18235 [archaeon]|nr:MAG: hypothetical protein EON63_18235 [archaeon]